MGSELLEFDVLINALRRHVMFIHRWTKGRLSREGHCGSTGAGYAPLSQLAEAVVCSLLQAWFPGLPVRSFLCRAWPLVQATNPRP